MIQCGPLNIRVQANMNLTEPPFFEHLLFENPWPAVIALGAVGVALLSIGSRRGQKKAVAAGAVALALAVGAYISGRVVTTDRETLIAQTEKLVEAATDGDVPTLRAMLEPRATVTDAAGVVCWDFKGILDRLESLRVRVGSQQFKSLEAEAQQGRFGRTYLVLRTTAGQSDQYLITHWLITWAKSPDGTWQVKNAQWLQWFNDPYYCGRI
jgi:Domain of unknown function (DUF4440)